MRHPGSRRLRGSRSIAGEGVVWLVERLHGGRVIFTSGVISDVMKVIRSSMLLDVRLGFDHLGVCANSYLP